MLEALLSARRVLYVSWTGRSVRDNSVQPPSVLVSQLRDYLDAGWPGEVVRAAHHRAPVAAVQPPLFLPIGSRPMPAGATALFTHAREWRAAHAGASRRRASRVPAPAAGEPAADARWHADDRRAGAVPAQPGEGFFRNRLAVVFAERQDLARRRRKLFASPGCSTTSCSMRC